MSEAFLEVKGVYSNLAKIGETVEKFSVEAGLDARSVYAMQMAVDEACSNIIGHAYGGEGKGVIKLHFRRINDGVQVVINDTGRPFNPENVPEPNVTAPLAERQEGGLGLFLMRQLMDEVSFDFGGGKKGDVNTLVLFKRIKT